MTVSSVSACVLRFPGLLTARDLEAARGPIRVELSESALARIGHCREFVDELLHSGRPIYGATTGYGALVGFSAGADMTRHSQGLVDFLSVGQGPPLAPELVRAMLLARVWSLAQGNSGVSPEVVTALIEVLTTGLAPVVPEYGSVGASGDLVPLAHAIGALMGRGEIIDGGIRLPAAQALSAVGLPPLTLAGRDGLALVNGTALTSAPPDSPAPGPRDR